MIGVVAGQEVGGCNPAATVYGTISPPFYADAALRKLSILTTSSSSTATGGLNVSFAAPATGKMSFELKNIFDAMSGGTPAVDAVTFEYSIYCASPFALLAIIKMQAFEDGTFRVLVFDSSSVFPASYDSGYSLTDLGRITFIFNATSSEYEMKIGGSAITLSGIKSFTPSSAIQIGFFCGYSGLPSGKAFSSQVITSASAMLYGEGVTICGDAI